MIELINVSKEYADKLLFENVNLTIYDGERVGIVGENGCGKSTLLKIINGEIQPDSGSVTNYDSIGYLKQITEYNTHDFLDISSNPDCVREFLKYRSILHIDDAIDFTPERLHKLSGGEKTKLMLAHILSQNPSTLILDEPTNHMDLEGVDWLIKTLDQFAGTIIIVSHDRYLLNNTINKIVEIENGKVEEFYGNYNDYYKVKQERIQHLQNIYDEQRAEERKINRQIAQLNQWSNKGEGAARRQGGMLSDSKIKGAETNAQVSAAKLASAASAKISRLEQQKENFIERPYTEGKVHYKLNAQPIKAKVLIKAQDLSKEFNGNVLFKDVNFEVCAGEKIALVGKNGCGKTTLLRMIMGEDRDYKGSISITPSVKWSYLSQDVLDLDDDMTVMQTACLGDKDYRTLFLSNLINMNMSRQTFERKISTLSSGERMRIKMCEAILNDFNLLILDEPTNHLDLANKIFMEKILKDYKGALIIVSHDKQLIDNVATSKLIFENNTIKKKQLNQLEMI